MGESGEDKIVESIDKLSGTTDRLIEEVRNDSLGRTLRVVLVIVTVQLLALIVVTTMQVTAEAQRHDIQKVTSGNQTFLFQLKTLLATVGSATVPTGCISQRNEAFRSEAVRHIENVNRGIHGLKPVDADPVILGRISTPCAGETKP